MSGRLFVDRLIDRIMSAGVPTPQGARMGAYRPADDRSDLVALMDAHARAWQTFAYKGDDERLALAQKIVGNAAKKAGLPPSSPFVEPLADTAIGLIATEPGFFPFSFAGDVSALSLLQAGELARDLSHRIRFVQSEKLQRFVVGTIETLLVGLLERMPSVAASHDASSIHLSTEFASLLEQPHEAMTSTLANVLSDERVQDNDLFAPLSRQLHRNLLEASGVAVDPDEPLSSYELEKPILPNDCAKEAASKVAGRYFANTPLADLLTAQVPFVLPQKVRFEHCHVLGGIGHGKTQCLQYMLNEDLIHALLDEMISIVVIDSHGDLIRNLSSCALFDPEKEESLADRFVLIDPSDIERPPALNLFNPGLERLETYSPRQRELAFNSLVDIYGRFFGALLGAELTAKQGTVFRYLARLMLTIDGATIHTLIALMDDVRPFAGHIAKLDPTARRFFDKEFSRKGFNATRQQIKDRLYAVLSIPTFDRLFSAPRSKINFFDALNSGKIVLIDTAKSLLKEEGTAIFGRFMLALIEHAITERATMPEAKRNPVFLYMDEAHEYFDDTVEAMIIEARKFRCGLTLAHQNLAQLRSPKLRAVFTGNTTIKIVGGVTDQDARSLAADMRCSSDFLLSMKKREARRHTEFALSVRNVTPQALKITIPFGHLESHPTLKPHQRDALLDMNRQKIGYDPNAEPPRQAAAESPPDFAEVKTTSQAEPNAKADQMPRQQSTAEPNPSSGQAITHRQLQKHIKQVAQKHGFVAIVEKKVLDGAGSVDVSLEGADLRIACEISITTKPDHERHNVDKCLIAGFDQVWVTSPDPRHLEALRATIGPALPKPARDMVCFYPPGELIAEIEALSAQTPASNSTVLGYEVVTQHTQTDDIQATERRKRLDALLGRLGRTSKRK